MKVILLNELKGRGGEGDVIDVATGYAVNFLFPRRIALAATKGNLKQLELRKHNIAKRETERLDTADGLMSALEGQRIRISAKVGEEGQLFGSVTPAQIADAINERFGVEIDRRRIDLHGAIKTAGEHPAVVSIYRDVKATVIVEVVDENAPQADAAALADEEKASTTIDAVEEQLEEAARSLAVTADAIDGDGDAAQAVAAAAVEVLRDIEGALDAAVVGAVAATDEEDSPLS
ncbi:MAG: 50S ribosomal protein L9 [Coriobacteriales bacterium]|jgi:large subunit ribosomal protein L9|nr:50S ribosomal protein L9 [Coriobacteriales bacterium]